MPIISGFPTGGNAKFPDGGKTDQVLLKTEDGEAWGYTKTVSEKDGANRFEFTAPSMSPGDNQSFVIEFTEEGDSGPSKFVQSFNGRAGDVIPQRGDYTADMVGSVPITRTVNGKSLSADITLDAAAIDADPTGSAASALSDAKSYADGLTASDVGAIPVVNGSTGQFLGFTSPNVIGAVDAPSNGGKRVCRFTVGTLKSGWRDNSCDYLCTGANDQVRINEAIQALPETGGEIVILDGTYNITAPIVLNKANSTLRGNGAATILKRMWNSGTMEGIVNVTADNCTVCDLCFDGNRTTYNSSNNNGLNVSQRCFIIKNFFYNNCTGILTSQSYQLIMENICEDNKTAISITGISTCNKIVGNLCINSEYEGIKATNVNNSLICHNTCYNNSYGIYLTGGGNNNVSENICSGNNYGIYVALCVNIGIIGNTCIRGTGQPSDYSSSQQTIYLTAISQDSFVIGNVCMGKAPSDSGENNTLVNNKYN